MISNFSYSFFSTVNAIVTIERVVAIGMARIGTQASTLQRRVASRGANRVHGKAQAALRQQREAYSKWYGKKGVGPCTHARPLHVCCVDDKRCPGIQGPLSARSA
jgi:hypothetical protein